MDYTHLKFHLHINMYIFLLTKFIEKYFMRLSNDSHLISAVKIKGDYSPKYGLLRKKDGEAITIVVY